MSLYDPQCNHCKGTGRVPMSSLHGPSWPGGEAKCTCNVIKCTNCGDSNWETEKTPIGLVAYCTDCYTGFELLGSGSTKQEAIEAWNQAHEMGLNE